MCTLDGLLTHRLGLGRGSATLQGGGDAGLNGLGLSAVGTTVRAEGDPKDLRALARGEVQVTPRKGVARHGGLRPPRFVPAAYTNPGGSVTCRDGNIRGQWIWKAGVARA